MRSASGRLTDLVLNKSPSTLDPRARPPPAAQPPQQTRRSARSTGADRCRSTPRERGPHSHTSCGSRPVSRLTGSAASRTCRRRKRIPYAAPRQARIVLVSPTRKGFTRRAGAVRGTSGDDLVQQLDFVHDAQLFPALTQSSSQFECHFPSFISEARGPSPSQHSKHCGIWQSSPDSGQSANLHASQNDAMLSSSTTIVSPQQAHST